MERGQTRVGAYRSVARLGSTQSEKSDRQSQKKGTIMNYWIREVAGWLLLVVGLFTFWNCYLFLLDKKVLQAGPMMFIGFIVFRGGLHLLKVAAAAQAARGMRETAPPQPRRGPT